MRFLGTLRAFLVISATFSLVACGGASGGDDSPFGDARAQVDGSNVDDAAVTPGFNVQFVDPDHGPFTGGTEVTVRGDGFGEGMQVLFGGRNVEPLDIEVIDSRRVTVRTPPGDPGAADVEVRFAGDSARLEGGFTYEAIAVDPPSGSVAGGTYVTITGFGTNFDDTTVVTFDGVPLSGATTLNEQTVVGYTPPGTAGSANVRAITAGVTHNARRAYTYLATADPFFGGLGGGPINGTVNVAVVDGATRDGVDDAYVVIGDPATSLYQGNADALGQITFSGVDLVGPITVTATAPGYDVASFVTFDATDVTVFLRKPPEPNKGPLPPGRQDGRVYGHIVFGDALTLGSPTWDIVPEPRTPTEVKRAYVTTSAGHIFTNPFPATNPIDYEYDPDKTAWPFVVNARPSALAVVAVVGLYDPARDPYGSGVAGFEPFAMGVARGVLVGPGEDVMNIDIVVNIPLDTAIQINLDKPPRLDSPGWPGPDNYKIRPFIDLGGEGVIAMNVNGLARPHPLFARPNEYTFDDGAESIVLSKMAPLVGNLADTSYTFQVGAWTGESLQPFSVRIARGFSNVSLPIEIGDFLGVPRPTDPLPDGMASGRSLHFTAEGPSDGDATFHLHYFSGVDGIRLLSVHTRDDVFDVDIPNLSGQGFGVLPANTNLSWTLYRIRVPGVTFNEFNYRQLSALYWDAYAADANFVRFP